MPRVLLPRVPAPAALVVAVAIGLAGCGGGSTPDPASVVPASAPIYVEATLHPHGDEQADAKAVLGKLLHTADPARKLQAMFDRSLRRSGERLTYTRDFAPWIGDRAAVALLGRRTRAGDQQTLIVIDAKDGDKAQETLGRARHTGTGSYRDTKYYVDQDTVAGLVGHEVVLGDLGAFRAAVDVKKGGSALADGTGLKRVRDHVADERGIGLFYTDIGRLLDAARRAKKPSASVGYVQALMTMIAAEDDQQLGAALIADRDALRIDGALLGARNLKGKGNATAALEGVPADSWFALGLGGVGATAKAAITQTAGTGPSGMDPQVLLSQLKASLGIDINRDLLSWMGDAALFMRGSMLFELNGALVVHSTDPARSAAALPAVRRLLRLIGQKPRTATIAGTNALTLETSLGPVWVVAQGDRFVIALGSAGVKAALSSRGRLGDTPAFRRAAGRLTQVKPSFYLDTPNALNVLGPILAGNRAYRDARDALSALGPLAGGAKADGKVQRFEAVAGVR